MTFKINDIPTCCPDCHGELNHTGSGNSGCRLVCVQCDMEYPFSGTVPVLIEKNNPMFNANDIAASSTTLFSRSLIRRLGSALPQPTAELGKKAIRRLLNEHAPSLGQRCLVIGSGDDADWNDMIADLFANTVITDVATAPQASAICDGHKLPFPDNSFDSVTVIAVLEHVLDPEQVVSEVGRVLRKGGMVVADVPFMQQVHLGAYDFKRYSDLGLRWLFRNFDEIERGVSAGPASVLVWAILYLVMSIMPGWRSRLIAKAMVRLVFGWIKYADYLLARRPGACDGASGLYFVGTNRKTSTLAAGELVADYRGSDKVSTT